MMTQTGKAGVSESLREQQHPAFALFTACNCGILSTLSSSTSGYPFGSVVPYCLGYDGVPLILISDIAEHTRNLIKDSRASLIALDGLDGDVQARGRVTIVGDLVPLDNSDSSSKERYYRYFPESRGYHKTHNFAFYTMRTVKIRYIGGFGAIHWVNPSAFYTKNTFSDEEELPMVQHMNEDHQHSMARYCELADYPVAMNDLSNLSMAGIDQFGFHIKAGEHLYRFEYESPADTPMRVRQELVKMAKR